MGDDDTDEKFSSTLAATLMPFAKSTGFVQYGTEMKDEPINVPLLQNQKNTIAATIDVLDNRNTHTLPQSVARAALEEVYSTTCWHLQHDVKEASEKMANGSAPCCVTTIGL